MRIRLHQDRNPRGDFDEGEWICTWLHPINRMRSTGTWFRSQKTKHGMLSSDDLSVGSVQRSCRSATWAHALPLVRIGQWARAGLLVVGSVCAAVDSVAASEQSQDRSWSAAVFVGGSYQWPTGRLVKNTSDGGDPSPGLVETVSELLPSPVWAGGVEIGLPARDAYVRLGWMSTIDAEASGQLGICTLLDGALCTPVVAPVVVREVFSDLRLVRHNSEAQIRPVVNVGIGLRRYSYIVPTCPTSVGDARRVCIAVTDLYADARDHLVLRFGLGVRVRWRLLFMELGAGGSTGRYRGGAGRAHGSWYQDFRAESSIGATLF